MLIFKFQRGLLDNLLPTREIGSRVGIEVATTYYLGQWRFQFTEAYMRHQGSMS